MAAAFDGGHAEETSLAKLVPSETHGGRAVVAACNLTAGTVVLRSLPAAYAVHDHLRSRRCAVCLRKASSQLELQRCTQCRCLHYCSKRCQLVDWKSGHKLECRHLQGMGDGQAAEDSLLAIRCLRLLKLHSKQDEAKAAPACVLSSASGQLLPPPASPYQQTWPDVAAMCMVEDGSQLAQPDAKKVQADLVVHLLRTGVASQRSAPIIGDLLQRFPANNFSITDDLVVSQAAGVYPLGALLNHSCLPNCIVTYDESTHVQEVRTACAVTAGTELTHSFVNLALSTHDRQEHLKAVYGFNCKCPRCIASCVLTPGAAVTVPNTAVPTRPQAAELAALAFSAGPALTQGNKASISEHTTPEQLQSLRAVDDALHAAATCKTEAAERELLLAALDAACSQLHPLHSKLGELHSALQHVCMVMGDMGAAAQHAAFLACQLRHTLSACGGGAAAPAETGKHAAAAPGAHTPATDGFVSAPDAVLAVCAGQLPPHPLMALQVGTVVELLHAAQPAEDSVQWEFAVPSGGEWMHRCLPTRVRELFDANAALLRVVYGWQLLRRPSAA